MPAAGVAAGGSQNSAEQAGGESVEARDRAAGVLERVGGDGRVTFLDGVIRGEDAALFAIFGIDLGGNPLA